MTAHSSLDELNQAIERYNPFESHYIVKSQHVWDEEFPDVFSLHAQASNAILESVQKINSENLPAKTVGFTLLAPKGVGKTHVLSRIRQGLKLSGDGFFIYMCEYGNLSLVKCQFLQNLASSLKKIGSQGVMQWQELATALVGKAVGKDYTSKHLIDKFPEALSKKPQIINQLTSKVLQTFPDVDNPYIVRAIIWTLSQTHAPFAINWLAGRELSESQATLMDLPNPVKEDRDAEAFNTARQILDLISHYTTPVICFDELDGTESGDEEDPMLGGFTRAMVVASLAKDLYNNLKRGVLITAMYAKTWREEFLSISSATAIKDRIAHQEIELNLLKPDDVVALVSCWLQEFYSKQNLTPPHAVYPFDEAELRQVGEGSTVRDILQWCAKNFSPGVPIDPIKKLEGIYQSTEPTLDDFSDDNGKIANAIAFGLQYLKGQTIDGVTIKELDREVKPKSKHYGMLNFRILAEENGKDVKIGVCVLQNSHGRAVGAGIKYLTWYDKFDLTRGCLVRSKDIPDHWQVANQYQQQLLEQLGGEWVSFKEQEIKPLLILREMSKTLEEKELSVEDFHRFIDEKNLIIDNPLIREILSAPSGEAPQEVVDEDFEIDMLLSQKPTELVEENEELDILATI